MKLLVLLVCYYATYMVLLLLVWLPCKHTWCGSDLIMHMLKKLGEQQHDMNPESVIILCTIFIGSFFW